MVLGRQPKKVKSEPKIERVEQLLTTRGKMRWSGDFVFLYSRMPRYFIQSVVLIHSSR